ncbi:hypothetical protein CR513_04199, partial [Mucuna pruriens]
MSNMSSISHYKLPKKFSINGQIPSQIIINPQEIVIAITLRSGKELPQHNKVQPETFHYSSQVEQSKQENLR